MAEQIYTKNAELQKYITHYKINIPHLYHLMESRPEEDKYNDFENPIVECWFSSGEMTMEWLEEYIDEGKYSAKHIAEILQGQINKFEKKPDHGFGDDPDDWYPEYDEL